MAKKDSKSIATARKNEILQSLKQFGQKTYDEVESGRFPEVAFPSRSVSNIVYDPKLKQYVLDKINVKRSSGNIKHIRPFTQLLWLAYFADKLVSEGKTSTLRDAYYSSQADSMEFVDQAESDEIITDLETVLSRAREEFKIYPEERSAIFGDVTIEYTVPRYEGRRLNLNSHPDGYLIGPSLSTAEFVETSAEMVIAVEKGGIFTRFVEEQVDKKYKAILIDTSGQAPRSTRYMLQRLNKELNLPVYIMTDGDVYGEHIAMVVISGSVRGDEPIVVRDTQGRVRPIPIGEFADECIGKFGYFSDYVGNDVCSGIPFEVLTVDEKNRAVFKPMISVIRHRHKGEMITLHTAGGRSVTVTPSHSVFVFENATVVCKPTSALKTNDLVVVTRKLSESTPTTSSLDVLQEMSNPPEGYELPKMFVEGAGIRSRYHSKHILKSIPTNGKGPQFGTYGECYVKTHTRGADLAVRCAAEISLTKRFARLLGYYTADGCVVSRSESPYSVNLRFGMQEPEVIEDALDCVNSVFPGIDVSQKLDEKSHAVTLSFGGAVIASLFLRLCGSGLAKKKVPTILFSADKENVIEYLQGCFGDGQINSGGLCWKSRNPNLIAELGYLLTKLGVQYSISGKGDAIIVSSGSEVKKFESVVLHTEDQLVIAKSISKGASDHSLLPSAFPVVASGFAKLRKEICRHQYHDSTCKYALQRLSEIERECISEAGINRTCVVHVLKHILQCNHTCASGEFVEQASHLLQLVNSDIAFDPIVSMESNHAEEFVYDVSVPETERFVGGRSGILLHNSANAAHLRDLTVPTAKWIGVWASITGDEPVIISKRGMLRNIEIERFFDSTRKIAEGGLSSFLPGRLSALCCSDRGELNLKPIRALTRHSYRGDILQIRTEGGFEVKTTVNHSVQRFNRTTRRLEQIMASNLKKGDLIASCFKVPNSESLGEVNIASLVKDESLEIANRLFVEGQQAEDFKEYLLRSYSIEILAENFPQVLAKNHDGVNLSYFFAEGMVPDAGFLRLGRSRKKIPVVIKDLEKLSRLMGYHAAVGRFCDFSGRRVCELNFKESESALVADALDCLRSTFRLEGKLIKGDSHGSRVIRYGNSLLAEIYSRAFGIDDCSNGKQIPFVFFNVAKKAKMEFLTSYLRADGVTKHSGSLGFVTEVASRKLASDLVVLLRQLGATVRVQESGLSHKVICEDGDELRPIINKLSENKTAAGRHGLKTIPQSEHLQQAGSPLSGSKFHGSQRDQLEPTDVCKVGFKANSILVEPLVREEQFGLETFASNGVALLPIVEITRHLPKEEVVYDIEVDDDHTFVGGLGGIVLHNSDIVKYQLPTDPMTEADMKRAQELKKDPRYHGGVWQRELDIFLKIKRKSELEAFSKYGLTFIVTNYLKEKMEEAKSM